MVSAIGFTPKLYYKPTVNQTTIQSQLESLKSAGSKETGISATELQNTQTTNNDQQVNGTKSTNNTQTTESKSSAEGTSRSGADSVAWASIMKQLGLKCTGDATTDAAAVSTAIQSMQPDKVQSIISSCQASGLSVQGPENKQQTDPYVGQNQLAEMNKYFMLKKQA